MNEPIVVTGVAGFIGFHVAKRLLDRGFRVFGVDNLNSYYDPSLKDDRLKILLSNALFKFERIDIASRDAVSLIFSRIRPKSVIHLAAQAGVRHSLTHPHEYIDSNLVGFANILEGCRAQGATHLVYASSSSVYGSNSEVPFAVHHNVDHPVSLYAATKKANELMAHTYSHLFDLPTTGLRFFTVYGPWGRPDMAYFKFTQAILAGKSIDLFNYGKMKRDFTYIDDIVEGILLVLSRPPTGYRGLRSSMDESQSIPPYKIYNIGNETPVELLEFVNALESALGMSAQVRFLPMQPGDVPITFADMSELKRDIGFRPATSILVGLNRFVEWYRDYYKC